MLAWMLWEAQPRLPLPLPLHLLAHCNEGGRAASSQPLVAREGQEIRQIRIKHKSQKYLGVTIMVYEMCWSTDNKIFHNLTPLYFKFFISVSAVDVQHGFSVCVRLRMKTSFCLYSFISMCLLMCFRDLQTQCGVGTGSNASLLLTLPSD